MSISMADIKEKLERAYNDEDWNIVIDLIEALSLEIENDDDLFETVDDVEKEVQKIGNIDDTEIVSIREQMPNMMKRLEDNMKSDGLTGIPSGFLCIDNFTSGWQKQDLIIIGGAS